MRWVVPVTAPVLGQDGPTGETVVVTRDQGLRSTSIEALVGLRPVIPDGIHTAGNSSQISDGAAAVLLMSRERAEAEGLRPRARIIASGMVGSEPYFHLDGPVQATSHVLERAGMKLGDIDLVEINEAFAAQVIPSYRDLGIDLDRLNVNGGAIAVGHPFGMTGARITGTLINSLQFHDKQFGLETMCVGGGQGMAMVIERLS